MQVPDILCIMRLPPDLGGHGGSQRAWHLAEGLARLGRLHFVMVFRDDDLDCVNTSLGPLARMASSITRINIAGWRCSHGKQLGIFHPGVWELARMRSHEAPLLSRSELAIIAAQLPLRNPDIIFAGRLCSAVIAQALIDAGHLSSPRRVVDFDDIMSKYRARQVRNAGAVMGKQGRMLARLDSVIIARAERHIARRWDAISVCTDEDTDALRAAHPATRIVKIPNAVQHAMLAPRVADGCFRILFAGNLSFPPNQDGLLLFLRQAWPAVRQQVPNAKLTVVGLNPPETLVAEVRKAGGEVHANVPTMKPHYQDCDITIAPIVFGSGTRIKILESMAFGRAVVSTSLGAEGMHLRNGHHILLADNFQEFASAIIRLEREPIYRDAIVRQARAFQQAHYSPAAILAGVEDLVEPTPRTIAA